ncbi:hypothetical protein [Pediococcus acidilactici]|nr:hypothetical protein [Pediococcus acidilactici]
MAETLKTQLLDKQMKEVFDWSDDSTPVRNAMWNHVMDSNGLDAII